MTKQEFEQAKITEQQIEALEQRLKQIESGKILNITVRVFSEDKMKYEDVILKNMPKSIVKAVLRENVKKQLEDKRAYLELMFNKDIVAA